MNHTPLTVDLSVLEQGESVVFRLNDRQVALYQVERLVKIIIGYGWTVTIEKDVPNRMTTFTCVKDKETGVIQARFMGRTLIDGRWYPPFEDLSHLSPSELQERAYSVMDQF